METIDINNMTPEQLAQIEAQLQAKRKAEREKQLEDLKTLAQLENEAIAEMIADAEPICGAVANFKRKWVEGLKPLIAMKIANGKARADQKQYSFKDAESKGSASIRYNETNKYDDGINVGIGYAKEWLSQQANDEKSKQLVSIIDDLLSRNGNGDYTPSDLMKFVKKAKENNDELLLKAADAIIESLYEEQTSVSLVVCKKDEFGVMRQLPLSVTKA